MAGERSLDKGSRHAAWLSLGWTDRVPRGHFERHGARPSRHARGRAGMHEADEPCLAQACNATGLGDHLGPSRVETELEVEAVLEEPALANGEGRAEVQGQSPWIQDERKDDDAAAEPDEGAEPAMKKLKRSPGSRRKAGLESAVRSFSSFYRILSLICFLTIPRRCTSLTSRWRGRMSA